MGELMSLTAEQEAAMPAYVVGWIERGLDTSPVDWVAWEAGARECYRFAGVPWPGVVVRVPSPIVGAFAAPIAAHLLGDAVVGAVDDAVRGAVRVAVGDAVDGAVDGAVRVAVGDAVDDAVRDAVRGAVRGAVDVGWYRYLGGQMWMGWVAWRSFFRDIVHLDLPGDMWDRHAAYEATSTAGWWWPHQQFVMVCDRPQVIHREQVGPTGWGSHRLHNATGPSIAWDGWALWHWHGIQVPQWVVEAPTVEQIAAETNTETRRCAIESFGWPSYLDAIGASPCSTEPDPGNPGQTLTLFDLPDTAQVYEEPVRLLVMTNGSPDRDGTIRSFAETVPVSCGSAVDAAAWQFDVDPATYRALVRAT